MAAEVTAKLKLDAAAFRASVERASKGWSGFSKNLKTEASAAARTLAPVAKGVAAIGAAATAAAGVTAGVFGFMIKDGLALNSQMEQARATFTAFTKDASLAKQIVADIKTEAGKTPFDTTEMVSAGKALISSAKGSREELMKLIKTAEVLAALKPEQGLEGAAYALREAMGGDFVSLQTRFDISRNIIKEMRAQGKEGLDVVNAALEKMGAGPELIKGLAGSFEGLKSNAGDFFDQVKQTMAEPLFESLENELRSFVDFVDGSGKEGVQEFAKAFGENINEGVKDVFAVIKSIDWHDMAEGAKEFATALGTGAANTGIMVQGFAKMGGKGMNVADKLALGVQTFAMPFTWGDFRKELEESNANFVNRIKQRHAGWADAENFASKLSKGGYTHGQTLTNDVLNHWLHTRGKTQADLAKDKELMAEVAQKFGGAAFSSQDVPIDTARALLPPPQVPAKTPVQVTLNQTNPMHTVMAT